LLFLFLLLRFAAVVIRHGKELPIRAEYSRHLIEEPRVDPLVLSRSFAPALESHKKAD